MHDGVNTLHASPDLGAVDYRPDPIGKVGVEDVQADNLMARPLKRANQRFVKMSGAARDQDLHSESALVPIALASRSPRSLGDSILRSATPIIIHPAG